MPIAFRIVPAGDSALIVEFEERIDVRINVRAIRLAASIEAAALAGIRDVVPTYRSVAVYFDPLRTNYNALMTLLEREAGPAEAGPHRTDVGSGFSRIGGPPVRVPVCYGGAFGPDLGQVAAHAGLTEADVIARHSTRTYRVFMMGFVPGFSYLGNVDPSIAMPRRVTPRVRVPAGSVGIAGSQTGIYPVDTPGGWQLVGRTPLRMFDLNRRDPFLLKPGDTVQFYPAEPDDIAGLQACRIAETKAGSEPACNSFVRILRPGLQTTIQDRGRWGLQSRGVPTAGPMDLCSHRVANALVGNDTDAAALEVTLVGPEIEFDDERIVAVAGAEFALTVDGRSQGMHTAFVVPAGSCLGFGARSLGARAYLAVAGGFAVPEVLGSRSTHLVSRMGGMAGRALAAGDRLPLGNLRGNPRRMIEDGRLPRPPRPGADTRLRVLPGPQRDRFAGDALEALQSGPYTLRTESDRMGFRLEGPALRHAGGADIISDATPLGVLQVPASGEPVLLMADRQTTGGYPNIATVISADISVAGQLAPADRIQFEVCSLQDAMAALIRQEQALMTIESASAS